MGNQISRIETTASKGPAVPFATAVATPPAAPQYGVQPWQVSGVFTTTLLPVLPALAAGNHVQASASVAVTGFPPSLVLKPSDQGAVFVNVFLATNQPGLLLGLPYVTLTFGSGSPLTAPNLGQSTFVLQPGRTYSSPAISLTLTAYYLTAALNPITVPIAVQAVLYGIAIA